MITLIYGPKGSGKTKKILDAANDTVGKTKGSVVFMGDSKYAIQLNTQVRFFNAKEYRLGGTEQTIGFVKGVLAGNFDITEFFIDGAHRITGATAEELKPFFDELEYLSMQDDVDFTVSLSTGTLPAYLQKYV